MLLYRALNDEDGLNTLLEKIAKLLVVWVVLAAVGGFLLTYKTPDFLDKSCHQNDTTDTDFAHIERGGSSISCIRENFL